MSNKRYIQGIIENGIETKVLSAGRAPYKQETTIEIPSDLTPTDRKALLDKAYDDLVYAYTCIRAKGEIDATSQKEEFKEQQKNRLTMIRTQVAKYLQQEKSQPGCPYGKRRIDMQLKRTPVMVMPTTIVPTTTVYEKYTDVVTTNHVLNMCPTVEEEVGDNEPSRQILPPDPSLYPFVLTEILPGILNFRTIYDVLKAIEQPTFELSDYMTKFAETYHAQYFTATSAIREHQNHVGDCIDGLFHACFQFEKDYTIDVIYTNVQHLVFFYILIMAFVSGLHTRVLTICAPPEQQLENNVGRLAIKN